MYRFTFFSISLFVVLLVGCDPGQPVSVTPRDAAMVADQALEIDQDIPDMSVDAQVVDMAAADAALPDYVEDLEPSVQPPATDLAVTGTGDLFRLFWWRGGRAWQRDVVIRRSTSLTDEEQIETLIDQSEPEFLRFVPPYEEGMNVLRPSAWPADEAGYLIAKFGDVWRSVHLSSQSDVPLPMTSDAVRLTEHDFGPSEPSSALVVGVVDGRVQTALASTPETTKPVGQRDAPLPVAVGPMGHLWLLAYGDGHCTSFTSESGMGEEVGNWRCFADSNTRLLGRGTLASDSSGPVLVSHTEHALHIWDPRPGVVTNPWLTSLENQMDDSAMSSELPDGWTMQEQLGHQVLQVGEAQMSFHARRGQTIVYVAVDIDQAYWVLVNRHSVVVVEKTDGALSAWLALDATPTHVLWDGVEGVLNAVPLNTFAAVPVLSIPALACASRSAESCGLVDSDCDGDAEGGICCSYSYSHSDVSTLSESGAFSGPWFVSKSDLGALLAVSRASRIELMHVNNQTDQCFACVTGLGQIDHFAHTNAVIALLSTRGQAVGECPANCSTTLSIEAGEGSDAPSGESDEQGSDDPIMNQGDDVEEPTEEQVLLVHPTPGQLVTRSLPCRAEFLETANSDRGVRIIAVCAETAIEYEVVDGILSETPLTIALGEEPARWIGPQTRVIFGGRYVSQWLTAHGESMTLKRWSFGLDGLVEDIVPDALQALPQERRTAPIRLPVTDGGDFARLTSDGLGIEVLRGDAWVKVPSQLWVESVQFSRYEDFAISVVALRDPAEPGFDPIEQTLAVYGHDLSGIDSPWGQYLELESTPILGYSFQGAVLPEWSHYDLEPNIWWSVGRDNVAPTIKRLGLACQPTARLEAQKESQ
ncbi:MAG: hypothetical protein ACPGQS_08315 [Bradymonadia bacterium]